MASDFLLRRNDTWCFHRRVPLDVHRVLGGSRFWRISLGTTDRKIAEPLARQHATRTDAIIAAARDKHVHLTAEQKRVLDEAGGFSGLRDTTFGALPSGNLRELRGARLGAIQGVQITQTVLDMAEYAARPHHPGPVDPPAKHLDADTLAIEIAAAEAVADATQAQLDRNLAILAKDVSARLPSRPIASPLAPFAVSPARQYAARRFAELFPSLPLKEITRQHGVEFVKALARLPRSNGPKLRPLTIQEAIAEADRQKLPRLERATVRQIFFRLSAMLNDAANDGLIPTNPLQGYRFPKQTGKKHAVAKALRRQGFTPDEMRKLDEAPSKMGVSDRWVFLLGAYQGARREECAQLRVADVQQRNGVWCMQVTDEAEGQRVKNPQSVRLIPLHASLIARGFIDHVQNASGERLFPDLLPDKLGRISDLLGQRFKHRCRRLGINKSFHSLRHAWKSAARNASLPEDVAEAISGRQAGSAVSSKYGDLADPAVLAPWLNRVDPFADPVSIGAP